MNQVVVYGADYCPFCVKVKDHLEKTKVPYDWIDTETTEGAKKRTEVGSKHQWKTIPMVFVQGQFVGGCDDFFKALNSKKITLSN